MKKQKIRKLLHLSKETLRHLEARVVGGTIVVDTTTMDASCRSCNHMAKCYCSTTSGDPTVCTSC